MAGPDNTPKTGARPNYKELVTADIAQALEAATGQKPHAVSKDTLEAETKDGITVRAAFVEGTPATFGATIERAKSEYIVVTAIGAESAAPPPNPGGIIGAVESFVHNNFGPYTPDHAEAHVFLDKGVVSEQVGTIKSGNQPKADADAAQTVKIARDTMHRIQAKLPKLQ